MPLEFVKSNRGKDHLVYNGHRYNFERMGVRRNSWVCEQMRHYDCLGRAYTANNEVVEVTNHNHTAKPAKTEVKCVRAKIKDAAESLSDSPQAIVASCSQGISASASVQLPPLRTMKRTIRKIRARSQNSHPIPSSLLTLQIPDKYQRTAKDENFLLHDSGPSNERILIFGTMKNLHHMQNSQEWYADGTFKVAPQLFEQLYTIHIKRFNKVFPTIYALLPKQTESTYVRMLKALKELAPNMKPQSITTDFEKAAKNAFKAVFPETSQHGCLFHFGQCFYRRIQKLPEVHERYSPDSEYQLKIKCLTALAFVPPPSVKDAFHILTSDEFYSSSPDIVSLVDYVEENWIGGTRRGRDRPPRFGVSEWNCYQRVLDDRARTNNATEGWHRGFHSQLGATHPTIWSFIEKIKKQQSLNELQIEQQLAGETPQPQRKKSRDTTNRLKLIVEDFENRRIVEYLTGIAHIICLNV